MNFESYLSNLPDYNFAITYGSGVFKQEGYSEKEHRNAMLDIIIGVENPELWHKSNIKVNPDHYSSIRLLGSTSISCIESWGFGHVYYNRAVTGPKNQERPIKYGVISMKELEQDLLEWDSLYVSGRLHKPVRVLRANTSVIKEMNKNLSSAVLAVLPLLPSYFSDRDLFLAITGLSYNGDIRTWFAENPNKVQNIVNGIFENFQTLYQPIIKACPFIEKDETNKGQYRQVISIDNLASIISLLPSSLHAPIRKELQFPNQTSRVDALTTEQKYTLYKNRLHMLFDPEGKNYNAIQAKEAIARGITNGVRHVVFRSSVDQAIRGNLSFGVLNSVFYVAKKIKKFIIK